MAISCSTRAKGSPTEALKLAHEGQCQTTISCCMTTYKSSNSVNLFLLFSLVFPTDMKSHIAHFYIGFRAIVRICTMKESFTTMETFIDGVSAPDVIVKVSQCEMLICLSLGVK
jgi:hypothetical protein